MSPCPVLRGVEHALNHAPRKTVLSHAQIKGGGLAIPCYSFDLNLKRTKTLVGQAQKEGHCSFWENSH